MNKLNQASTFANKAHEAYINGGADNEETLRLNETRLRSVKIVPRVLRGTEDFNCQSSDQISVQCNPLMIGPSAFHQLASTEGEIATAHAANITNTPYIVSCTSSVQPQLINSTLREDLYWQQLYLYDDKRLTELFLNHAIKHGARALVVTVGSPIAGKRTSALKAGWKISKDMIAVFDQYKNLSIEDLLRKMEKRNANWSDIAWLRSKTDKPIVLKGILDIDDAKKAIDFGCSGIVVTNHGGRQMDGLVTPYDVLEEIRDVVQNQLSIYVGDGIRTGLDILKALSLGADRVLIGRPVFWMLNEGGADKLISYINGTVDDLKRLMILSGCNNIDDIQNLKTK